MKKKNIHIGIMNAARNKRRTTKEEEEEKKANTKRANNRELSFPYFTD